MKTILASKAAAIFVVAFPVAVMVTVIVINSFKYGIANPAFGF